MRFLADVQLPKALVRDLRRRGHEADRVVDLVAATASDDVIVTLATLRASIILPKDEDFVRLAGRSSPPVTVIWFRCGNVSNAALLALVDREFDRLLSAIEDGQRVIQIS